MSSRESRKTLAWMIVSMMLSCGSTHGQDHLGHEDAVDQGRKALQQLLQDHEIPLPVVEGNRIVGLVHQGDILRWLALHDATQSENHQPTTSQLVTDKIGDEWTVNLDQLPNIEGDARRIHQVFRQIINNAIKYTLSGKVEIVLSRNMNNHLSVSVSDTGIGISKEYMPDIFKPFYQEDQGYSRKFEGNGLGLALVKKYCEMNKLLFDIRSEKDVGSTFTVVFPDK